MKASSVALLVFLAALAQAADEPSSLGEVERRLEKAREEAEALESESTGVLGALDKLDRAVTGAERRLAGLEREIGRARTRLAEARKERERLERELAAIRKRVTARAAGLYRLARRGLGFAVLRAPANLGSGLRTQRSLQSIVARDHDLLREADTARTAAEAAGREAETAAAALATKRDQQQKEIERLRRARDEKTALLASLREEGESHRQLVGELEDAAKRLRALLEKTERESAGRAIRRPPNMKFVPPLAEATGAPVPSRNGVEIPAAEGAVIRAVADGRVAFADWFPGYGRMVIVDHGGHLHSIYAFAADILVEAGKTVATGTTLGRVGRTGTTAEPRLYFEIRSKGVPEDASLHLSKLADRTR